MMSLSAFDSDEFSGAISYCKTASARVEPFRENQREHFDMIIMLEVVGI